MKDMKKHYGEIVEKAVRRNGYSISELARLADVNRRSVYNWFGQQKLKPEIIYKVGLALKYDFSSEFPELFTSEDFQKASNNSKSVYTEALINEIDRINYWKDKYVDLLEEYNQLLARKISNNFGHMYHVV